MASLYRQFLRNFVLLLVLSVAAACSTPKESGAAPYAAYVMDARTGQTLYSENADTRLHPASLTKMMTLYITFQEIEKGNLSLDTMITVSKNAAAQPPSRLGLKEGQKIQLRYLIRAAAVKSANDAAAAIGDALSGNPTAFGKRMTRTAKALGMKNTTFKNANGLTADGHLSTAHDMSILGRRLFYDFPQYYNIFSRRTTDAGIAEVANTNRRFLDSYEGADGIKTGYTVPAGFNLTASAERNGVRIIATVFGGTSTAQRNAKMAQLLDLGFAKAPAHANVNIPTAPAGAADEESAPALVSSAAPEGGDEDGSKNGAGKTIRVVMTPTTSPRPKPRPGAAQPTAEVVVAEAEAVAPNGKVEDVATVTEVASVSGQLPPPPNSLEAQAVALATGVAAADATKGAKVETVAFVAPLPAAAATPPKHKAKAIYEDAAVIAAPVEAEPEVVTSISTSGGRHWGITVGRYTTHSEAERVLLKTQLLESATLNDSLRKVVQKGGKYDANFMGLTQDQADLACRRLQARAVSCFTLGP